MKLLKYIPNSLALLRMILAIPLAHWLWDGRTMAALILLLVAGITDLLDGYLAREFGWRTVVGSWLDPTADKILITTALVTLTAKASIPLWFCILIIGRDVVMVVGILRLVLSGVSVKIRPPLTGKLAVTTQNLTLLAAMLLPTYAWASHVLPTMLVVSTLATMVSSVSYAKAFAAYRSRQAAQSS